jgi:hypothetical protein
MGMLVTGSSVCIAEYEGIIAMAMVALCIVAYLFWSNFKEKRERRRQQRVLEQRRRAREAAGPQS